MAQTIDNLDININVDVRGLPEIQAVQRQVGQLDRGIRRSTSGINRNAQAYNQNAVATNKWAKGALQQAGYQVGDFAVQVANGTSGIQAFGQQGSQLLGIFGPIGAVLGAGVAIFSAFAVAAERAGKANSAAAQSFMDINSVSLDSIRGAARDLAGIQERYNTALEDSGTASSSSARLTIANSEKEFQARQQLLMVERELLRLRSQDQIQALENLRSQQDRMRESAMETMRNIGAGATFDPRQAAGGFAGGATASVEALEAALGSQLDQMRQNRRQIAELEAELIRLGIASDEAAAAAEMVFSVDPNSVGGAGGGGTSGALRGLAEDLDDVQQRAQDLANSMQSSFEKGFMSIIEGNANLKDSFKAMARDVIAELYRIYVVKRLVGSLDIAGGKGSGIIGKIFGGFLAQGGVAQSNRSYIVGERGPELFTPSTSGRVIPNNQLNGGGQPVIVNQTINVSTGVQQTVRTEIKQLMPQIAESAKQAVVDAKRRGGSYGRAFA